MHHVMFDIDDTLVQSNDFDSNCFIDAVKESIGITIDDNWSKYKHVTDSGILDEIISSNNLTNQAQAIHKTVKEIFVDKFISILNKTPYLKLQEHHLF